MTTLAWTYAAYLAASGFITVYVARTLRKHGRWFLIDCFAGDERLADTANYLLVVGFYLVNIAFVLLTLKSGLRPASALQALELLSSKIGLILCVLGAMHFFNLLVFSLLAGKIPSTGPPDPPIPRRGESPQAEGRENGQGHEAT